MCSFPFATGLRTQPQAFSVAQMRTSDPLNGSNLNVYGHKSVKSSWNKSNDLEFLYVAQTYSGLTKWS